MYFKTIFSTIFLFEFTSKEDVTIWDVDFISTNGEEKGVGGNSTSKLFTEASLVN